MKIKNLLKKYITKETSEFSAKFLLKTIILSLPAFLLIIFMNLDSYNHLQNNENFKKIFFHWGIWFSFTSYIVFWEARHYFKIYPNFFKKIIDMKTLIGLASHILFIYSIVVTFINFNKTPGKDSFEVFWEPVILLLVFTEIGHAIENKIIKKTSKLYDKISNLLNKKIITIKNNKEIIKNVNEININDVIVIKKGDIVPLDGILINNEGLFDKSNITGESKIIKNKNNDKIVSGSYNVGSIIKIKVTNNFQTSFFYQIANSIEEIGYSKPKIQKIADKMLKWFIPFVFLSAFLTFLIVIIINNEFNESIKRSMTVLAIACPCTIGIATPLINSITSYKSLQMGLLINSPKALEEINEIKYIVFDKTGTLTENNFQVDKIVGNKKKYLSLASSLEAKSNHPIGKAIACLTSKRVKFDNFSTKATNFIIGKIDQEKYELKAIDNEKIPNEINKEATVIGFYKNDELKLIFELNSIIKKEVVKTIEKLKAKKLESIMITGDNKNIASRVANEVGIATFYHSKKPNEKGEIIKKLQEKGKVVFVGDGFNDAIAAKQANLSFSFKTGSEITNEIASISIHNENFNSIYKIFNISQKNNSFIKLSLFWAIIFNLSVLPLAFLGIVEPWMGALIMISSDFLIIINAFFYRHILIKIINRK